VKIKPNNRDKITTFLKSNPLGLGAINISEALKIDIRSIQRSLLDLKKNRIIKSVGQAQNTIYQTTENDMIPYDDNFFSQLSKAEFLFTKVELEKIDRMAKLGPRTIELDTFNSRIYERLIIDLSWSSSFLEGNTYSLLETENLILNNKSLSNKDLKETQMILNHKDAIKLLVHSKNQIQINESTLKSVHALLSEGLLANRKSQGTLRKIPVGIEGTRYVPLDIPQIIQDEFTKLIRIANQIKHPVEQSFFIFIAVPYLQAFEDLNKRTARVSCNIPLLANNYIPISFLNVDREDYFKSLKQIYEYNQFTDMKNLFLKCYLFSIEKYKYIKQNLVTPSATFIKYRNEIKSAIYDIVDENNLLKKLKLAKVPANERLHVLKIIKDELESLHIENLIRFGLSPVQFKKWKKKY
jgi:Fic family protein